MKICPVVLSVFTKMSVVGFYHLSTFSFVLSSPAPSPAQPHPESSGFIHEHADEMNEGWSDLNDIREGRCGVFSFVL